MIWVSILTVLANICVAIWSVRYNVGKNRTVYELRPEGVINAADWTKINGLLKDGDYTVLFIDRRGDALVQQCILGRVKKSPTFLEKIFKRHTHQ